jgi:WD40 repeat protein
MSIKSAVVFGMLLSASRLSNGQERKIEPRFRLEHDGRVASVTFSPDGKLLATGCGSTGKTVLWDLATGMKLRELAGTSDLIRRVSFSPDGKSLAAGGRDKVVHLWNVETGAEIRQLPGHRDEICSVAFSPDGKSVLSGEVLGEMRLWDPASGELRKVMNPKMQVNLFHLEWSPDSKYFAVASTKSSVYLVDATTGKQIGELKGHAFYVTRVRFSADGKNVAAVGLDNTVRIWEVTGDPQAPPLVAKELASFSIENGPDDVAFMADRPQVAVAHRDGRCSLWDVGTNTTVANFQAHQGGTRAIALSPDGKLLATGGRDKTSAVWVVAELTRKK